MEEKRRNGNVEDIQRHFVQMLLENGMRVWEFDMRERKLYSCNTYFEEERVIENAPDSIIASGMIHSDDVNRFRELYEKMYLGERQVSTQLRAWVDTRKTYVWVQVSGTVIEDEDGVPARALFLSRDISEMKQLERRFADEARYWEKMSGSILATGRRNLTTGLWEEVVIHGMTITLPEEIRRTTDYRARAGYFLLEVDIADEDNEKLAPDYLIGEYARGVRSLSFEYNAKTIERSEPVRVRVDCSLRKRPETQEVVAFYYETDVTQEFCLRSMMDSMMKHEYDLVGVLFAFSNSIYSEGKKSDKVTVLPRLKSNNYDEAAQVFMQKYACGDNVEELMDAVRLESVLEHLGSGNTYIVEFDVKEPNGEVRRKELRYSYIDREKALIAVSRRDIQDIVTAEKEKQEALENALNYAERANGAKSEFLSRMSHEMRTPMNAIVGLVTLAKQEIDNRDAVRDYLDKIGVSGKLLMNLINDVLDMAKIESGRMELHTERCCFCALLEDIESIISPLCEQKGIDFVCEGTQCSDYILVDKLRFRQIFINLLSNAAKFTPQGGVIYFKHHSRREGTMLAVEAEVADSGMGMSEEFQARMFLPFTQEEREGGISSQGTGLGLAITKAIVDQMDGTIQVDSHVGHGTRFVIKARFPLAPNGQQEAETDEKEATNESLSGRTILLVEDHPMNQLIARRILQNNGAKVVTLDNGKEAVDYMSEPKSAEIDAVLMDIRMPVMDGLTASKLIRELPDVRMRRIPIIAMTANAFEEDVEKAMEAGMNFHLAKPIEPALLLKVLLEYIEMK